MSTKCKYNDHLPAFIDGTLSNSEHDAFTSHLEDCSECVDSLEGLTSIEKMLEQYNRSEPSVELLYAYQTRMDRHFPKKSRVKSAWEVIKNNWSQVWDYHPRVMNFARAAAFILVGVLIGKFVFYTPSVEPDLAVTTSDPEIMILTPGTQDVQLVNEFFTQSEILLLAIKHTDENQTQPNTELQFEKQLAQNLLFKSQQLQGNMIVLQDQELKSFLDKLELVLLEISNTDDAEIHYIFSEMKKIIANTKMVNQSKKIQKKIEKMI